jgi:hypothetical protein
MPGSKANKGRDYYRVQPKKEDSISLGTSRVQDRAIHTLRSFAIAFNTFLQRNPLAFIAAIVIVKVDGRSPVPSAGRYARVDRLLNWLANAAGSSFVGKHNAQRHAALDNRNTLVGRHGQGDTQSLARLDQDSAHLGARDRYPITDDQIGLNRDITAVGSSLRDAEDVPARQANVTGPFECRKGFSELDIGKHELPNLVWQRTAPRDRAHVTGN